MDTQISVYKFQKEAFSRITKRCFLLMERHILRTRQFLLLGKLEVSEVK